ncbi:hypothetical protein P8C59_007496 [Phyllachora maydis]|uniref:FAD-binding FR-type domain-containing protein n=1 Tax=Phyllachora maydis TaxID=1825666 RepID=A0AAD9I966_9PEZI|nr:hypothetical protein P8C59_007496 [Phyllachora maydis]
MSWISPPVPAAPWFEALPLDDARCNNCSCDAFLRALQLSQSTTRWKAQFRYGWYTTWAYCAVLSLFVLAHACRSLPGLGPPRRGGVEVEAQQGSRPTRLDRVLARLRRVVYYRPRPAETAHPLLRRLALAVPSTGTLVLFCLLLAATLALALAPRPYYRPKRTMGSPPLAIRAGLIAFALYPLTLGLAGRPNLITRLTGLGPEKLNGLHRLTGYLVLLLGLLHAVPCLLVQPLRPDDGPVPPGPRYFARGAPGAFEATGVPALLALLALAGAAVSPLRRRAYECFKRAHAPLAALLLGLSFWHAANVMDSWAYLYAAAAVWALSLGARLGAGLRAGRTPAAVAWPATVEPAAGGMVRVCVAVGGQRRWEAGQYFYLGFPGVPWAGQHPFTACNRPGLTYEPKVIAGDGPAGTMPRVGGPGQVTTPLKFLIRPRAGVTGRIGALVAAGTDTLDVCVDGPYGTVIRPSVAQRFDNVVLVAGGGGISCMLAWLEHLAGAIVPAKTSTTEEAAAAQPVVVRRITLVWVVRSVRSVSWAEDDLTRVRASLAGTACHMRYEIFVTQGAAESRASSSSSSSSSSGRESLDADGEKSCKSSGACTPASSAAACVVHGAHIGLRPDLGALIPSLVQAGDEGGRTMVLGCGPPALKADLSNAVAAAQSMVLDGRAREIRLHTETFDW